MDQWKFSRDIELRQFLALRNSYAKKPEKTNEPIRRKDVNGQTEVIL